MQTLQPSNVKDHGSPEETKGRRVRTHCLACEALDVEEFLDLGRTALANKFLTAEEIGREEPTFPLRVGFCHTCGHVQLTEIVPPAAMFEDYLYVSSASDTLRAHLSDLSDVIASSRHLGSTDLVIDIGCNDGTLLKGFQRHRVRTLGVDPAANLAELAAGSGLERFTGFFAADTASQIAARWGCASVITATNTFPHIPNLPDFIRGIETALAPGGVFVIEAHYLVDMLDQGAFDTVYHEHVSYWALGPMMRLFERHGFRVVRAERLPIHHGQLRVWVQRLTEGKRDATVDEVLKGEQTRGIDRFDTYLLFAKQTREIKDNLRQVLRQLRADGKRVAAYGAPAKGNTLLGYLELGPDLIEYIVDRSTLKQGRYAPGTHIPVVAPSHLLASHPDYMVLLAWNFQDEILEQQAEYRRRGGLFIVPVPRVTIV
jgi:cyclopropane fatty-acyl-phospholipid synthase-like methyltransferase